MYSLSCAVVFQLLICLCTVNGQSSVAESFRRSNIVPNIVLTAPEESISVKYSTAVIDQGTKVNPLQTLLQPDVSFEGQDDKLYTLLFFGPDVPPDVTPPLTQFFHWGVTNIPGSNIEQGDTFSPYFPPTPYPGGFPYIFLIYEQNSRINADDLKYLGVLISRPHFAVNDFAENYNLTGPVFGNFMREAYLSFLPGF